jgi:hypothetical protein
LARDEPHFANGNVRKSPLIVAADDERQTGLGRSRRQRYGPCSLEIGQRVGARIAERYMDFLVRGSAPPYADRLVALKDHVVAENVCRINIRMCAIGAAQTCDPARNRDSQDNAMKHGNPSELDG